MTRQQQDRQSRLFYELSALVLDILRFPPSSLHLPDGSPAVAPSRRSVMPSNMSPAGFASLLLGISLSLMLCGSVTFFIGFLLMPWVLGLVLVFYVIGIVSSLSMLGRAILCHAAALATPRKEISDW
ncbi:uncharacterized protein LOC131144773 [Malania oleifera]|uniref:uncharacterized protein LOC131144773 n=1 Tax=Malania oleifera TaxID=397392 RepID=UPI0025ADE4D4|nr:uncharacterized protein LOC131144773 [Malania oleifera]